MAELDSSQDYDATPAEQYARWMRELEASKKELEPWHRDCEHIDKRYTDDRKGERGTKTKWNLFTSNVHTQRDMLYGKTPQVDVERRFEDSNDHCSRVAGEMLERLLNTDIARDSDSYSRALRHALMDYLLYDFGNARVRYVADFDKVEGVKAQMDEETGQELAPAVPETEELSREDVETDFIYWSDQRWSPARTFEEVRWWAFRCEMSKKELEKRFGPDLVKLIPLNSKKSSGGEAKNAQQADPWARAEVWEIWSKEDKKVYWLVEGYSKTLDEQEDPYELEGFWPFPHPMTGNGTTSALLPVPDFNLARDLYDEVDDVSGRITRLERVIRAAGVYDKSNAAIGRLINEAGENELIPIENFMSFMEKGGVAGAVAWLPLEQFVGALDKLRDYRTELVQAIFQITGMSDIMRGQSDGGDVTATEQGIKARFASVRMQAKQDEFARFASEIQKLKAELISKKFHPETILQRSNAQQMGEDPNLVQDAVQLIKSGFPNYRVVVKPEAVSMTDFAALKSERMQVLGAMTTFIQSVAPLAQQMPGSTKYLLELLQWTLSGIRGSSTAEGILDQAIAAVEASQQQAASQPPAPPPPDPKVLAQQAKTAGEIQKIQVETQSEMQRMQAETGQLEQRKRTEATINVQQEVAKQRIKQAGAPMPFGPGGAPNPGSGGIP